MLHAQSWSVFACLKRGGRPGFFFPLFCAERSPAAQAPAPAVDLRQMEWLEFFSNLLGGLAMLLYGMHKITESMKLLAGDKLRDYLVTLSRTRLRGFLVGTNAILHPSHVLFQKWSGKRFGFFVFFPFLCFASQKFLFSVIIVNRHFVCSYNAIKHSC